MIQYIGLQYIEKKYFIYPYYSTTLIHEQKIENHALKHHAPYKAENKMMH